MCGVGLLRWGDVVGGKGQVVKTIAICPSHTPKHIQNFSSRLVSTDKVSGRYGVYVMLDSKGNIHHFVN